jgi:protein-S-isoprenylcysteine O-methyltransferase Ste14
MKLFLKNLLFTLLIPGTVTIYIPLLVAQGRPTGSSLVLFILGVLLLATGAAIYLWTVWDFATFGRGTPLPIDAPSKLVVRGLYRYTRNPMYLGVLLVILGWAGVFADAWLLLYAAGCWVLVDIFVVIYEEPTLRRLFSADYEAYCHVVGRWLPHLRRRKG